MFEWSPRANSLFLSARELSSGEARERYLDGACGDDHILRSAVQSLLEADQQAEGFLESAATNLSYPVVRSDSVEQVGTFVGPYKLLQEIGEGGMGLVYKAEQTAPVQRIVALKVIKPGIDTRRVLARFEAERQAVALMDHPSIAKVLDAGATETGRPYFVMELVKGLPITEYCRQSRASLSTRLELFREVCQAVQHAHQKGIIHRDLKPSNVMIAFYDGRPVPKVIDFGVAKATGVKLTDHTMFTEFGTVIGTLEYMSPEQAGLDQLDVDTRTDVYSLGVLLYELLTGATPLDAAKLRSAGFDEARRIIREEQPVLPSTRLSSSDVLPALAAERGEEPLRLTRTMRGDLDWIVMKALEKNRERRYDSAGAFARDIGRYLADEPIEARPPSTAYLLRKFVHRNRRPVAAAALVAASLVVGISVSEWQALRATRAEQAARAQAERAEQAAQEARDARTAEAASRQTAEDRLRFLVTALGVQSRSIDPATLPAQAMNESWDRVLRELDVRPSDRAAILLMIGRRCFGLRRYDIADRELRECLSVATTQTMITEAKTLLGSTLLRRGLMDEGVTFLNEVLLEQIKKNENPDGAIVRDAWPGLAHAERDVVERPGQDGLQFDGAHDYVILPKVYFDGRPPWTIEAIAQADELEQYPNRKAQKWTSLVSSTDGGSAALECNQGKWSFGMYTSSDRSDHWEENYSSVFARGAPELHHWGHLAGVWDGKQLRLYVDGVLQESRHGIEHCSSLSDAPFFLGADPANPEFGYLAEGLFHGRLRAVRISHGVEYTAEFAKPDRFENTPQTLAHYDFTVDTGHYAIDRSGHGRHGIIVGAKFVPANPQADSP